MWPHALRIGVLTALLLLCLFRPFMPGSYDGLAAALSLAVQVGGLAGLVLVPVGASWLAYAWLHRAAPEAGAPVVASRHRAFAVAALLLAIPVSGLAAVAAAGEAGSTLGVVVGAASAIGLWRAARYVRTAPWPRVDPVPVAAWYLVLVPLCLVACRALWLEPAAAFSRDLVMRHSASLIADLEAYRSRNGEYPLALAALWPDYQPSVAGVRRFEYARRGEAYNLYFEQPSHRFGTREIVMYNPRDDQEMTSHASVLLRRPPGDTAARRGYYAVHAAGSPHWKYFWFD